MSSNEQENFSQYLKREREQKGFSLEKLSQTTRIPVPTLKALEGDSKQTLPSPAFIKGFLRNIGRELGIETQELVARYDATYQPQVVVNGQPQAPSKKIVPKSLAPKGTLGSEYTPVGPEEKKTLPPQAYVLAALVAIFLGILLTYFSRPHDESKTENAENAAKSSEAQVAATQTSAAPAIPAGANHGLVIRAKDDCWVKINIDQNPPIQNFLQKGTTIVHHAEKRMEVFLGNASAVDLTFNNRPVVQVTEPGASKRYVFPSAEYP